MGIYKYIWIGDRKYSRRGFSDSEDFANNFIKTIKKNYIVLPDTKDGKKGFGIYKEMANDRLPR